MQGHGNGQHSECDICFVEEIKEEKKNKLNNNLKCLEDLSKNLENSIKELKLIFEKINENTNNIKNKIKQIFASLRNALNETEDALLIEVDKIYDIYFKENIIKESEILSNKIKISLEKGKNMEKYWKDNKDFLALNECINIENNIKDINIINDKIKKCKINENLKIEFYPQEKHIDEYIKQIKIFGSFSNIDSLILNDNDNFNKFYNLVNFNLLKINHLKLIYRSTVDGFNYLSIVNKINNKSNLIFLYLTGKDRIFGAYIKTKLENINLNGSRKYYKDEIAFSFSLNHNKKYKILVPGNSIGFDSTYYILIGNSGSGNGFYYYQNIIYDKNLISGAKIYNFEKNSELAEGSGKLVDLEIFEVNLNE